MVQKTRHLRRTLIARGLIKPGDWRTLLLIGATYGAWAAAMALAGALGGAAGLLVLILFGGAATTLHASLQHEALHGRPARSAALNEALVFPSLGLLFPYRRFKTLHLRHHCDARLTDPYDDPESWYLSDGDWRRASPLTRMVLRANATLAGRMLLGPWLSAYGMWRADLRAALASRDDAHTMADAYLRHAIGGALALWAAWSLGGITPTTYALAVAWPGAALLMVRTYIEHRAALGVGARTAIVEAEAPFALLFLHNNLHAVHHERPTEAWWRLPEIWRADRAGVLRRNGGYHVAGYWEVARRWAFQAREPIAHPYQRTGSASAEATPQQRGASAPQTQPISRQARPI